MPTSVTGRGRRVAGNQLRANNPPVAKMITTVRYWVEEMHVDGFRFDLAGVLGEADNAPSQYWTNEDARSTVLQTLVDDPELQARGVRMIAEPWTTAYDASTQYPMSTDNEVYGWHEWNANFRDWWRDFLNQDEHALNQPPYEGMFAAVRSSRGPTSGMHGAASSRTTRSTTSQVTMDPPCLTRCRTRRNTTAVVR